MEEEKKEALAFLEGSRSLHLGHLIYIYARTWGIVAAEGVEMTSVRIWGSGGGVKPTSGGRIRDSGRPILSQIFFIPF
jgi:hypothetical protein